ncbi:hypothetical protein A6R68_13291 [Neotoma lepida]|uniref:UBC core domain-containing protein n=1 Tax=Neotoma lepida TaxID=56216 RepID=A0A1A6H173_NEOLE|nr:hypothetical protein A6R68_13291 [Neotoma lepida]
MANIAVQRIKREFKEVLKSEEVRNELPDTPTSARGGRGAPLPPHGPGPASLRPPFCPWGSGGLPSSSSCRLSLPSPGPGLDRLAASRPAGLGKDFGFGGQMQKHLSGTRELRRGPRGGGNIWMCGSPGGEGAGRENPGSGRYQLEIKIPETYPFNPPKVLAAAMTLRTVLLSLQALLAAAEPDDPQDAVVANQFTYYDMDLNQLLDMSYEQLVQLYSTCQM